MKEKQIKIRRNNWTEIEDNLLITNYRIKTLKELAELFPNRTVSAVHNRAIKLGLKKNRSRYMASTSVYNKNTRVNPPKTLVEALEVFDNIYPDCTQLGRCEDCFFIHSKLEFTGNKKIPLCIVLDTAKKYYRRNR